MAVNLLSMDVMAASRRPALFAVSYGGGRGSGRVMRAAAGVCGAEQPRRPGRTASAGAAPFGAAGRGGAGCGVRASAFSLRAATAAVVYTANRLCRWRSNFCARARLTGAPRVGTGKASAYEDQTLRGHRSGWRKASSAAFIAAAIFYCLGAGRLRSDTSSASKVSSTAYPWMHSAQVMFFRCLRWCPGFAGSATQP